MLQQTHKLLQIHPKPCQAPVLAPPEPNSACMFIEECPSKATNPGLNANAVACSNGLRFGSAGVSALAFAKMTFVDDAAGTLVGIDVRQQCFKMHACVK